MYKMQQFKVSQSEHFKKQVGLLTFTPSVSEWINKTNAIKTTVYVKKEPFMQNTTESAEI